MAGPVYRADPPEDRLHIHLDQLELIYHRPSGRTHMVIDPVPQILVVLGTVAADATAIVAQLARTHDFPDAGAVEAIAARLTELEAAGLIWRV